MATFLRKFATRNEYSAATLTQPCVSLITEYNEVKFNPIPYKALVTYDNGFKYNVHCDRWPNVGRSDIINNGYDYTKITDVVVGDCVSAMTNTCQGFTSLTSVTIPNTVTTIGSAFKGCTSLSRLELPSSITKLSAYDTVSGCTNLQSIIIYAETPPTCQYIDPLWGCDSAKLYVPSSSVDAYKADSKWGVYADRIFPIPYRFEGYYNDGTSKKQVVNENTVLTREDVQERSVDSYQPTKFSGMTSAIISGNIETIGEQAFYPYPNQPSLSSVTIGDSVKTITKNAFAGCTSLTSVTIPSGVTEIGNYAFQDCVSLQSITVEATTPPTIGFNVFQNTNDCPIYVPSASVSAYQSAWTDYSSRIQAIPTPKWIATYSDSSVQSGICNSTSTTIASGDVTLTNLTDIVIYDCATSIGQHAFEYASSLSGVTIPSSVTSIGQFAFYGCTSLSSVTIPDSVTSIDYVGFYGCSSLTSVTIPSGVTSIGDGVFMDCSALTSVTCLPVTPPTIGNMVFANTSDCPIYVPAASVSAYQSAWSDYSSRIQAIS